MEKLGGFRLLRPLDSGVLGHTHLAVGVDDAHHAVKELHLGWGPAEVTGKWVEHFLREVREVQLRRDGSWARYVMPAHGGYDAAAGRAWLATPFLTQAPGADDGRTSHVSLSDAVAFQPFPAEVALHLIWQLSGLARSLHAVGLSLAGLKPANLFLASDGAVVVDVHLAHVLRGLLHPLNPPADAPGRSPFLWADPSWLPPELRRFDAKVRESSSMYAVGTVVAFACTGFLPLPATDLVDALMRRRAARTPAEKALADWANAHGNAGTRLRRAAVRSTRRRPWARPGARRLRRIAVSPLRAKHQRSQYQSAWDEYMERLLRQDRAHRHSSAGSVPNGPAQQPASSSATGQGASGPAEASTPPPSAVTARRTPPPSPAQAVPAAPGGGTSTSAPVPATASTGTVATEAAVPAEATGVAAGGAPPHNPRVLMPAGTHHATPSPADRPSGSPGPSGAGLTLQRGWTGKAGGALLCPPLVLGGHLVVTCGSAAHLLDAETGEHRRSFDLRGTAESTPVLWGGRLWWALRDGLLNGHGLGDTADGDDILLKLDGDPGSHPPVTVDDLLLVGTTHGLFRFRLPLSQGGAPGQRVIELDEPVVSPLATDGVRVWVPTERRGLLVALPATGESRSPHQPWDAAGCAATPGADGAYIGDAAGTVHHISLVGTTSRKWEASHRPITAPPVVHEDLLLVVDRKGVVVARSLRDWTDQWRTPVDGDGRSAVTVLGEVVYVCGARSVRRLDARTGRELDPLTPEGPKPMHVTATPGRLHVSFLNGHLSTWTLSG